MAKTPQTVDSIKSQIDYRFVLRNTAGTWAFIDDATHTPKNGTSIVTNADNSVTINYPASLEVEGLVAGVDDTYGAYGIFCGLSVGLTNCILKMYTQEGVACNVAYNGTSFISGSYSGLWYRTAADITLDWDVTDPLKPFLTVSHPSAVFIRTNSNIVLNPNYAASPTALRVVMKSVTTSSFSVYFVDAAGAIVTTLSTSMAFSFARNGIYPLKNGYSDVANSNIWIVGAGKK